MTVLLIVAALFQVFVSVLCGFEYGVASGDPGSSSMVIWTHYFPKITPWHRLIIVRYEVSTDKDFNNMVTRGFLTTSEDRDYTVKTKLTGLQPNTIYYYRFIAGEQTSITGRTKTFPRGGEADQMRLAFFSCANWRDGYFNAYDLATKVKDVDFIVHLGDWFYEYGNISYPYYPGRVALEPVNELVSLWDYRLRHASFRTDPDLQALLAMYPLIAAWDDHESANDAYKDGAQNHNPQTEGKWSDRKQNSFQAFAEWMPLSFTTLDDEALFRSYIYGDLGLLVFPETRLTQRTQQIDVAQTKFGQLAIDLPIAEWTAEMFEEAIKELQELRNDSNRLMIGPRQVDLLQKQVKKSILKGIPWQIFGSQTVFGGGAFANLQAAIEQYPEEVQPTLQAILAGSDAFLNEEQRIFFASGLLKTKVMVDQWAGYEVERQKVLEILSQEGANGIIISGDSHTAQAYEVTPGTVVEFGGPSVTSVGYEQDLFQ
eukprot:TRINITY_DN17971_c0_g2_i6.p1 TRINITY_DN17971_c0_g2~~TRINITY_DN17971_c0_g2_i6.p1  ORF type:complete len:485 (-),score=63.02 TRINITY_DN17971_c0_g2_i6:489-1943(-)